MTLPEQDPLAETEGEPSEAADRPEPTAPVGLESLGFSIPALLNFKADISARTVIGLIACFALVVVVAVGAGIGVAGICQMAGLPGAWLAGLGVGTFVAIGGGGTALLMTNKERGQPKEIAGGDSHK
ncbi:hypothetical protein [Streptomyces chartreusis]|uniref:hypothetical protein n=1 Tax=Streptomyces chartreusis TaxID=1969 RepID=UPI00379B0345